MPKNHTTDILRRWRAMDAALYDRGGLRLAYFTRRWGVSEKTVRRDLEAFRELGQRLYRADVPEEPFWCYYDDVRPLFVSNLRSKARPAKPPEPPAG
jgi:hypothetical protein